MKETNNKKPLIGPGWLRVLLFVLFFALLTLTVAIVAGLGVALIKKEDIQKGKMPDVAALLKGELLWISTLLALVSSLLSVWLFRKMVDRKSILSLGLRWKNHGSDAASGFLLALVLAGLGSLVMYVTGHLRWTDMDFDPSSLFISLGIMVMVALGEEMVFRGYILSNLLTSFNKWVALSLSALLFTLAHLSNEAYGFIPMVNIFLVGILLGINYTYTRNLWFSICFHIGWNFLQGPLLGFRVSGLAFRSLLQPEFRGDEILTGGAFGLEGSVFNLAITLSGVLLLYWIYEVKYRQAEPWLEA